MSPAGWRWQFSARDDLTAQLGPSLRKVSRAAHLWLGLPPRLTSDRSSAEVTVQLNEAVVALARL